MRFFCACGSHLEVPDHLAGRRIRCPACRAVQLAPQIAVPTATLVDPPLARFAPQPRAVDPPPGFQPPPPPAPPPPDPRFERFPESNRPALSRLAVAALAGVGGGTMAAFARSVATAYGGPCAVVVGSTTIAALSVAALHGLRGRGALGSAAVALLLAAATAAAMRFLPSDFIDGPAASIAACQRCREDLAAAATGLERKARVDGRLPATIGEEQHRCPRGEWTWRTDGSLGLLRCPAHGWVVAARVPGHVDFEGIREEAEFGRDACRGRLELDARALEAGKPLPRDGRRCPCGGDYDASFDDRPGEAWLACRRHGLSVRIPAGKGR